MKRKEEKMGNGIHLLGELYNCRSVNPYMTNADALRNLCIKKVSLAELTIVGESFYQFESAGVTGAVILAESHLAIHTWPENGYVTMDVFVCNHSKDNKQKAFWLFDEVVKAFQPEDFDRKIVERIFHERNRELQYRVAER